jgi:hypothetical protein
LCLWRRSSHTRSRLSPVARPSSTMPRCPRTATWLSTRPGSRWSRPIGWRPTRPHRTPAPGQRRPGRPASAPGDRPDATVGLGAPGRPSVPVEVVVGVADPLGRETERTMVVPGWVAPPPDLTLEIVDVFAVVGRGTVANLVTSADPGMVPPYAVSVVVGTAGVWPPFPRPPFSPWSPFPAGPLLRPRSLRASWHLPDIPTRLSPVPPEAPRSGPYFSPVPGEPRSVCGSRRPG